MKNTYLIFSLLVTISFISLINGCYDAQQDRVNEYQSRQLENIKVDFLQDTLYYQVAEKINLTPDSILEINGAIAVNPIKKENLKIKWKPTIWETDLNGNLLSFAVRRDITNYYKDKALPGKDSTILVYSHEDNPDSLGSWSNRLTIIHKSKDFDTLSIKPINLGWRTWGNGFINAGENKYFLFGRLRKNKRDKEEKNFLLCLNEEGDTLWSRFYPEFKYHYLRKTGKLKNGNILLIGERNQVFTQKGKPTEFSDHFQMIQMDTDGKVISIIGDIPELSLHPVDYLELDDGGFIVVGNEKNPEDGNYIRGVYLRLTSSGELLWKKHVDLENHVDNISGVVPWIEGKYLLAGNSSYQAGKAMLNKRTQTYFFAEIDPMGEISKYQFGKWDKTMIKDLILIRDGYAIAAGSGLEKVIPDIPWWNIPAKIFSSFIFTTDARLKVDMFEEDWDICLIHYKADKN